MGEKKKKLKIQLKELIPEPDRLIVCLFIFHPLSAFSPADSFSPSKKQHHTIFFHLNFHFRERYERME
jgi:hypothetical protein